jgi:hypothetical protein
MAVSGQCVAGGRALGPEGKRSAEEGADVVVTAVE